ncbi:membrane protein DedA, SNARE-associated domain [Marininema mesophilum]|uniref:Membrane protein DedA, SNARE-associated domain n=1 Tax=Marininema mesophilum TaxID=1048340 RepID=A0A1H3A0V0_9BACL|nr:DedA family protein [Marininema mesophilum]SDX23390.1 membrane protein DedA, SNARE-associated domain [Marininema mesophilum]
MEQWITSLIEEYGYLGIFFIMVLENVFPPIPSELVLPFGGFMTIKSNLTLTGVIVTSTAGSVLGAIILYGIGLLLDVTRLEKLVDRWGSVLRIQKKDIHRANAWFDRYGKWTVFFGRMIPIVRSMISIPAGMSNMNFSLFLFFTILGTALWNIILVGAGAMLGKSWTKIVEYISIYSEIVYVGFAILLVVFIIWYIRRRKTT